MSKPFDQAFARAFSQPRLTSQPSGVTRPSPQSPSVSPVPWDGEHQIIIQVPQSDLGAIPSPHISVSHASTGPERAPTSADQPLLDSAPAELAGYITDTVVIIGDHTPADWIVAAAGVELPNIAVPEASAPALTTESPVTPEAPASNDTPRSDDANPSRDSRTAELSQLVDDRPWATVDPSVETQSTNGMDEEPVGDALSALDIPLLLEQEMLESLHRAAESMRSADEQLQRSTEQVQAFLPVWEIDRLHWPEVIGELEAKMGAELQGAAEGIRAAHADGLEVLGFTACDAHAGRTTTLLLLCKALQKLGMKIAIVDAANELATLSEQCGIDSPYGWNEAIMAGKPLEEAATYAVADDVTLIAWTPDATDSLARLPITALASQWHRLRHAFDVVLVKLPTTKSGATAALQHHRDLCDAIVLVRNPTDSDTDVAEAIDKLQQAHHGTVGIIENQHSHRH